ncbi:hypothetical protein QJQ45_002281 [Haematococcus lacustris]|nr:hypothetical protein QJQ45_002281 [Haematococcus lacustris]
MYTPVLKVRGIIADCDGFALVCCVKEEGVGWVVKRSKTGAGFATLFRLYFIAKRSSQEYALYALNAASQDNSLLAHDVKASGGLALFATAQKLLFISSRNSLCELDLQSGECRVITPTVWPDGGRLLTGNDQLALLIVARDGGSNFFSCTTNGKMCLLQNAQHSAVSADFGLNSRGDLLFIEQKDKELPRIRCLPALLPPPTACKCNT